MFVGDVSALLTARSSSLTLVHFPSFSRVFFVGIRVLQLFKLDLLFFRNDEFEPSPRGAWLLPEVHSYALLGWAAICAGLSFCLSSHLLR